MKPAARIGDMHICPMVTPGTPPIPHVGGPITMGEPTVLIGMMPAARMGDMCTCVGPPDSILMGSPTVLIGMKMAARMGDPTMHGGMISVGCPTVLIGESGGGGSAGGGTQASKGGLKKVAKMIWAKKKKTYAQMNEEAISKAKEMAAAAAWRLKAAKKKPDKLVKKHFGIDGTKPADQKELDQLIAKYVKIIKSLNGNPPFKMTPVDTPNEFVGKNTNAYVFTNPKGDRVRNIYTSKQNYYRKQSSKNRAAILIHELSHLDTGTKDHAYDWQKPKYKKLPKAKKQNNADNIENFSKDAS